MLPGLSIEHIIIVGVIALVVVGPKDLPLLLRKMGRFSAKLRAMAQEFRSGFDELARQAELDELKREVDALRKNTALQELKQEVSKPLGTLESYAGISTTPSPSTPLPLEGGGAGEGVKSSSESAPAQTPSDLLQDFASAAASEVQHQNNGAVTSPPPPPGEGGRDAAPTSERDPPLVRSAP